jgi:HSP20 family protein
LSFDDDFNEIFGDFEVFNSKLMKRFNCELDEIFKEIKNGKIKGEWEVKEINEPGVKGYAIHGVFGSNKTLEPFEPLKPSRRRPLPEKPFDLSEKALKEMREPLTDIFDENDAIKIYVELPGEEKEDIQLNIREGYAEIKTSNFYKKVKLPNADVDFEKMTSEYKNGVLKVSVPKRTKLRNEDNAKEKMV